jgi:hypothetical protein
MSIEEVVGTEAFLEALLHLIHDTSSVFLEEALIITLLKEVISNMIINLLLK